MTRVGRVAARSYFLEMVSETRRDWPFYAILLAYALIAFAATVMNGVVETFSPFLYLEKWLRPILILTAGFLTVVGYSSIRQEAPLRAFTGKIYQVLPPAKAASVLMFLALAIFHALFTTLKNLANKLVAFEYDVALANLDALIHFGDPWKILPHWEPLTRFLQIQYGIVWATFLAGMSFYAVFFASDKLRSQYIWTFLIVWIFLGNIVAIEFMSAGPVYYAQIVGSDRFQPLMDYLAFSERAVFSSVRLQEYLWVKYSSNGIDIGSGISAFPSIHLAVVTLWAFVAYRLNLWFGRFMVFFAALILIGSVHLGWHYAIDGYVAILVTVAVWKLVGHLQSRRSPIPLMAPAFEHAVDGRSARELSG